jgi:multidrug efflux system outer membrane protein
VSATAGLSSYELDLFGKTRGLSDAALQTDLASAETARATRIALIAETANAWLVLAADQDRLATARQTMQSAQRRSGGTARPGQRADGSERLSTARYQCGVDTYLNALVAQRTLYSAQQTLVGTRLSELQSRVTLYRVLGGGPAGEVPPAS